MHKNWKMHTKCIQNNKIRQHSNVYSACSSLQDQPVLQEICHHLSPTVTHSTKRGRVCCLKKNHAFLTGAFCLKCSRSDSNFRHLAGTVYMLFKAKIKTVTITFPVTFMLYQTLYALKSNIG